MWRHIEPDRLFQGAEGRVLEENETAHLATCEFCQDLLLFFISNRPALPVVTKPDLKAA